MSKIRDLSLTEVTTISGGLTKHPIKHVLVATSAGFGAGFIGTFGLLSYITRDATSSTLKKAISEFSASSGKYIALISGGAAIGAEIGGFPGGMIGGFIGATVRFCDFSR